MLNILKVSLLSIVIMYLFGCSDNLVQAHLTIQNIIKIEGTRQVVYLGSCRDAKIDYEFVNETVNDIITNAGNYENYLYSPKLEDINICIIDYDKTTGNLVHVTKVVGYVLDTTTNIKCQDLGRIEHLVACYSDKQ